MSKTYKDAAQFLVIYIKEAHPADDWPMRVSPRLKYIQDPTTLFERFQVASTCVADLKLSIPTLIDTMEDAACAAYKGHPDRLYVVGKDGKIVFHGAPGPRGFKPLEMENALKFELAKNGTLPQGN